MTDELSSTTNSLNQVCCYDIDHVGGSDELTIELLSKGDGCIRISNGSSGSKIILNFSGAEQLAKSLLMMVRDWRLK